MTKRFVLTIYLAIAVVAGAQSGVKPSSAHANAAKALDMDATKLPPHFLGDDAAAIYEAADKTLTLAKSEFESSSDYESRLRARTDKPFWQSRKADAHFAFVLGKAWSGPPPKSPTGDEIASLYGFVQAKYDADIKDLWITIPTESLSDPIAENDEWTSLWHRTETQLGSYTGTNAFGARRIVRRLHVQDVDLIIEDSGWLDHQCRPNENSRVCRIDMEASPARALAGKLRVVVVGSLVAPFTFHRDEVTPPTVDSPWELHHSHKLLHMRLDALLIANGETGEILRKYSRSE
jgi:hypothetical protein